MTLPGGSARPIACEVINFIQIGSNSNRCNFLRFSHSVPSQSILKYAYALDVCQFTCELPCWHPPPSWLHYITSCCAKTLAQKTAHDVINTRVAMTLVVWLRCLTVGFCVRQPSEYPAFPVHRQDDGRSSPGTDAGWQPPPEVSTYLPPASINALYIQS